MYFISWLCEDIIIIITITITIIIIIVITIIIIIVIIRQYFEEKEVLWKRHGGTKGQLGHPSQDGDPTFESLSDSKSSPH